MCVRKGADPDPTFFFIYIDIRQIGNMNPDAILKGSGLMAPRLYFSVSFECWIRIYTQSIWICNIVVTIILMLDGHSKQVAHAQV